MGGSTVKYNDRRYNRLYAGKLTEHRIRDNEWLDDFFAR